MSAVALVVAAAVLWLPGLLLARCAGASRGLAVTVAPALTWGCVGAGVIVLPVLHVPWRPVTVLAWTLALAGVLVVTRRAVSWRAPVARPSPVEPARAPRVAGGIAAGGVALAGLVPLVLAWRSGVSLRSICQLWDAVWHANLTAFIARTGSASPTLAPAQLTGAGWRHVTSFYPDGLHALAALVVDVSRADPLPSLMAVVATTYVVVLPVGVAALTWQLTRGSGVAAALAAVVSELAVAFPTDQWWRGVWSFGVSLAVAPLACALVIAGLRGALRTRGRDAGPARSVVLTVLPGALVVVGLTLLQPAAAVVAALVLTAWLLGRLAWLRWWIAVPALLLAIAALTRVPDLVWTLVARSPTLASLASFDYTNLPYASQALRQVLGLVTPVDPGLGYGVGPQPPQLALALVLAVAAAVALTTREGLPLVAVQVLVIAAATSTITQVLQPLHALTLFFYSSPYRLVAVETVLGAVLVGVAADRLLRVAGRVRLRRGARRWAATAVTVAVALGLGVVATGTVHRGTVRMRAGFADRVVGPDQLRVMQTLARQPLAPGARILNDSVDGSPWMYALTGAEPMFTHYAAGTVPDDVAYLLRHLDSVDTDPRVQRTLARRHICYVYANATVVTARRHRARGFRHLDQARSLQLVAAHGRAAAYRVTVAGDTCA